MSISPEDLKRLANELSKNNQDEVQLRTAISRYYYAAFHFIRNQLCQVFEDASPRVKKYIQKLMHSPLQQILGTINYPPSQQLSETLKTFHNTRITADYHLDKTVSPTQVELSRCMYNSTLQYWKQIDQTIFKPEASKAISIRLGIV